MKISILSMQRIVNFGSVLQAYSLREIIKELTGDTATFLDIQADSCIPSKKTILDSADYETPAACAPGVLQRGKRCIIAKLSAWNKHLIRKFMEDELHLQQGKPTDDLDCVIVGSDEVFNHKKGVCLQLHGDVKHSKKVFTYAASCGSAIADDIYPEDKEKVRAAMGRFAAVSVRDFATEQYVTGLYNGSVHRHLDPVLVGDLHKRQHRPVKIKKYLLVYAYGQRIRTAEEIRAIRNFAKAKGLKTVAMGGSQFWCDLYIPTTPLRLLDYFHFAQYVVTDTFHGTIFSVINKKQFAVIPRKTNRNKLGSLLEDLKLEDRMLNDIQRMESVLEQEIDYAPVEAILERERMRTRVYLKEQLEGMKGNDYAGV